MFNLGADFDILFYANPQPQLVFDTVTERVINVNGAACKQYGYTREEFLQLSISDLRPLNSNQELNQAFKGILDKQINRCHYKHKKKCGTVIDVEILSYRIIYDGKAARLAACTDITEQLSNKLRLEQALSKMANTLESISDGCFALNRAGTVISWNKSAEGLTGIVKEKIINKNFWSVVPEALKSGFYDHVEEAITGKVILKFEEHFPKLNKWFYASIYPSNDDVVIYFQDITELKNHQHELRLKNERLEEVAYFNSHELRRPVANIMGLCRLLTDMPLDEKEAIIQKIQQSCEEVDRVIRQIDQIQYFNKQ